MSICIALEFCDAGSLEDVIERSDGGVPHAPLGAVSVQMVEGLLYLHHELHQVHRDLKPANVMLTRRGCVKLSDFGISRQLENTEALAVTQCGTTAYMSPERLKGEPYSYVSDVWSAGLVVLEAVLGKMPYPTFPTFMALFSAICNEPAPTTPADSPAPLRDFVAACLRKEAGSRPAVAALLRHEWMKGFAAEAASAQPTLERWLATLG